MGSGSDNAQDKPKKKKHLRETLEAIAIAVVLAVVIRAFVVQAFKIPSGSMEDTLLVGDHIIVSKFAYGVQVPKPAIIKLFGVPVPFFETKLYNTWGSIERGDIIVFRFPAERDKDYIKRVVGLPGDTVELRQRVVYVNGQKWDDPYGVYKDHLSGPGFERTVNFGPYVVPVGTVFAMGDNRDRSFDSRFWGPVPIYDIKGKAFVIYWSWDGQKSWARLGRIGKIIR